MVDKPAAELEIDEALVRALLRSQAATVPGAADLPLVRAADGWDNAVWRLGDALAVRLPRRALAAPLIRHEQRVLSAIGAQLASTGIAVPVPVVTGRPGEGYPWPWSVVPWIGGDAGIRVPRAARAGWAEPLAAALAVLHTPAEHDHPVNPYRGVPLVRRADTVAERLATLRARGEVEPASLHELEQHWADAVAASAWSDAPVWIHGDLHPGNLVADGERLVGVIDFGDATAGDPAYDLAVAWLAFDAAGRARFVAATAGRYDGATWTRARGWAAAIAVLLLEGSDDNPEYLALGRESLAELTSASGTPPAG